MARARWTTTLVACVAAQTAAAQAIVVTGVVHADSRAGLGVANAEVSIVPGPNPVRTDSAGRFMISVPGAGPALLSVRAIGFTRLESTVAIDGPDSARVDVVIHANVVVLDSVKIKGDRVQYISPALREFEDRRRAGIGRFVSEATLRKMDNRLFADVMSSQVPGARIIRRGSRSFLGSTRTTKGNCYATVYIDGVLRYNTGDSMGPPDLSEFSVDQLGGVEFYAGEATAPMGYRRGQCGLLLLWTRER